MGICVFLLFDRLPQPTDVDLQLPHFSAQVEQFGHGVCGSDKVGLGVSQCTWSEHAIPMNGVVRFFDLHIRIRGLLPGQVVVSWSMIAIAPDLLVVPRGLLVESIVVGIVGVLRVSHGGSVGSSKLKGVQVVVLWLRRR